MSIQTATCYWLVCDTCGDGMENGDGTTIHHDSREDARAELVDEDWTVWEDHQWCWRQSCVPLCVTCGHCHNEHDDDGGPCLHDDCCNGDPCEGFEVPKKKDADVLD